MAALVGQEKPSDWDELTGKRPDIFLKGQATEEEKKFYEECKHDYKVMKESAKKHGIKNPILEIPMEIDF